MAVFDPALLKLLAFEGPYDNDPDDPGEETVWGIDKQANPNWAGWQRVAVLKTLPGFPGTCKTDAELLALVKAYYRGHWDAQRLSEVQDQAMAECVFNGGINQGEARDLTWLKTILNAMNLPGSNLPDLVESPVMDTLTIQMLNSDFPRKDEALQLFKAERTAAYIVTAHNRPRMRKFLAGWINRLNAGG